MPKPGGGLFLSGRPNAELHVRAAQGVPSILTSRYSRFSCCKRSQTAQTGIGGDSLCQLRATREERRNALMPRKGITGHDEWVVTEALATALVALEQLEPIHQPRKHMDDIRKLLLAGCQPGTANLHLAQAKCRLFPNDDRAAIYREYGLEDTEV